jgi:uncharacterized protein
MSAKPKISTSGPTPKINRLFVLVCVGVVLALSPIQITAAAASSPAASVANAVRSGDLATLQQLIQKHADVNAPLPDGSTALSWAVDRGNAEAADLLIHAGANLNAANQYGATPLSVACAGGRTAMVAKLLDAGADPNLALLSGETPLMTAVDKGNLEVVRNLLSHDARAEAKETKGGQTALMWAVADKQPEIVKLLLAHGADVHSRSAGGFTPLLFAAQQGDADSAALLLAAGADKNDAATRDHMTALMVATSMDHPEVAGLLLDKGTDPNLADVRGFTALHFAASSAKRVEIVKALLAHEAKPNMRTTRDVLRGNEGGVSAKGATPLFFAASVGNIAAVRALVAAGADPLIPTDLKTTPLHVAAGVGSPQARDWTDEEKNGLFETTKYLVSLGADVNAVGEHGWTPLHGAAYKAIDPVVEFLIQKGARTEVIDEYGQTPLSIASAVITEGAKDHYYQSARIIRQSTAELLLKLGAKPLDQSGIQIVGLFNEQK